MVDGSGPSGEPPGGELSGAELPRGEGELPRGELPEAELPGPELPELPRGELPGEQAEECGDDTGRGARGEGGGSVGEVDTWERNRMRVKNDENERKK